MCLTQLLTGLSPKKSFYLSLLTHPVSSFNNYNSTPPFPPTFYGFQVHFLTMRRLSSKGAAAAAAAAENRGGLNSSSFSREIDWELRPGGMLVQKRDVGDDPSGPMIKIKVSHGSYHYDITVPAQSTFGDLKKLVAHETGLEPKEQRLIFRGKEKEDKECLHMEGVIDMSKVVLLEDPASKEKKLEEMRRDQGILKACEAVAKVRSEVDKLLEKVVALESIVSSGTKVADKEFAILTELFMMQLLKLDSIDADGEGKVQRRVEVRRVQSFVGTLDNLKALNSNPFSNNNKAVSVTTKWETFDSGVGSLNPPVPIRSATKITQDWELFD